MDSCLFARSGWRLAGSIWLGVPPDHESVLEEVESYGRRDLGELAEGPVTLAWLLPIKTPPEEHVLGNGSRVEPEADRALPDPDDGQLVGDDQARILALLDLLEGLKDGLVGDSGGAGQMPVPKELMRDLGDLLIPIDSVLVPLGNIVVSVGWIRPAGCRVPAHEMARFRQGEDDALDVLSAELSGMLDLSEDSFDDHGGEGDRHDIHPDVQVVWILGAENQVRDRAEIRIRC